MLLFDSHTHTCFSPDADKKNPPFALCEEAVRKGLAGIAITDHCDVNGQVEGIYPVFERDKCYAEMLNVKEHFRGKLRVSLGIELGQAPDYPEYSRNVLSQHKYDFVLGSIHNLNGVPDFCYFKYEKLSDALCRQLFSRTITAARGLCDFGGISSIAHLTYMHRYMLLAGKTMDFSEYRDQLVDLFTAMIDRGIALELNVSLIRKGIPLYMPTAEIFRLYRDVGGKLVTVGSDAHFACDVGANIADGYSLLSSIGFTKVAFFENGTPELFPIA